MCDGGGSPVRIDGDYLLDRRNIGYTPVPIVPRVPPRFFRKVTFHRGEGDATIPTQRLESGAITLVQLVRFRIGWAGNAAGRLMIGHWAPDAWMLLEYKIAASGDFRITLTGSGIPSQRLFVGYTSAQVHDMVTIGRNDVAGFIEAGANVQAPIAHSAQLSGVGRRLP